MRVHAKWRLPPNKIPVRLLTKMDSNAAKYCRHDLAGKGYVIIFYPFHGTVLIFFTNTVQRVLLLVQRIWVKLSGKIGRHIGVETATIAVAQLTFIERPRTFLNG